MESHHIGLLDSIAIWVENYICEWKILGYVDNRIKQLKNKNNNLILFYGTLISREIDLFIQM